MEVQPKNPTVKGPSDWFRGDVWIDAIAQGHAGEVERETGIEPASGTDGSGYRVAYRLARTL